MDAQIPGGKHGGEGNSTLIHYPGKKHAPDGLEKFSQRGLLEPAGIEF